ncbi:MAG TPA: site-specific DNA-methyltransferase [Firmicutes bacterium]|jgi:DNA modification methylase|nr:site-specific DNA-methyltransferase [Bacillota bacterium]HHT41846.1 site-specific DNA-methyltransferase [Bacillota bacterium]
MGTKTRSFGASSRESHDSARFYRRRLYSEVDVEQLDGIRLGEVAEEHLNQVHHHDSRNLAFLPDNSVHLMITSPPYNVGKEYDLDLSQDEYLGLLRDVMEEVYRVLVPGGRACINIANVGRKPYIPLNSMINQLMLEVGYLMRGEIIWNKGASAGASCAWGSWRSASNPVLRDAHEYIMVYCKQSFTRRPDREGAESTISRDEFLEYTKSVWTFNTESAKRVNHPAPFPVELPYRLIQLYSFQGDIVLDPFCGSGTTCIAALQTQRNFIGVDNELSYVEGARRRLTAFLECGEDVVEPHAGGKAGGADG